MTYGENNQANYKVSKIKYHYKSTKFDLNFKDKSKCLKTIKNINVKLLGKHNVLNAAAALIVCLNLGVNQNTIEKSLKNFSGVQRRMTKVFSKNKNDFYDDYAHHPTEISSILDGVRNVNQKRKIIMHNILYKSHPLYPEVIINDTAHFIFQPRIVRKEE